MTEVAIKYIYRSIVRYLNGDVELAEELAMTAEKLHDREKKTWYKIGQVIPVETKEKIYKMVG
ncbi:MAG: hypothetical protein PWQ37_6 [Candidatus Petromonas sp.]|jgi:uncharacterized membrane protein YhaH (DUF805 family)|nr:hypothetical protein [Candidatus Petromonas sp.]